MTIAMLSLAGIPATAGFIGKFYLIDATVDGGYTWLGVVIVIGSMISLGLLPAGGRGDVDASRRRAPARRRRAGHGGRLAGGRRRGGRATRRPTARGPSPRWWPSRCVCAAATIVFGIVPSPLFDAARDAGSALAGLL